ncbi:MAG TPA: NAD-dependent epimerase/dehydratase family protein [Verrucomicrobiae bacterium]|nr:NAD-dependent epimerase/dehydratase family protein [Verrucomicrobiae bacterium]
MKVLITGSSGLIGSEAVAYYDREGHEVFGIDNNLRREFFGPQGDTRWNLERLRRETRHFTHCDLDIRERAKVLELFKEQHFDLVIHCAAQPSHDKAKDIPFTDFEVNALGTVNLLEATRQASPEAVFIFMSTNKVYGDAPNEIPLNELATRWDYARPEDHNGVREDCRIDRTMHSLFGASKTAADVMAQEYGRYFGMKVGVFRGGCLTGENHSAVQLHGFLSYLFKVASAGETYSIFGYKGKQVRDQIHSADVLAAFVEFTRNPRPGEVYNLGGGRQNSASILECIQKIETLLGKKIQYRYVEQARAGDHICYISDLSKLQAHFPNWKIRCSLDQILEKMAQAPR